MKSSLLEKAAFASCILGLSAIGLRTVRLVGLGVLLGARTARHAFGPSREGSHEQPADSSEK